MDKVFELDQSGTVLKEVLDHSITNATIPNSVTTIGRWAFRWCSSLKSVIIPNSVWFIGMKAFCRCTSLEFIMIPDSVNFIGKDVFYGCSSLKSILVSKQSFNRIKGLLPLENHDVIKLNNHI